MRAIMTMLVLAFLVIMGVAAWTVAQSVDAVIWEAAVIMLVIPAPIMAAGWALSAMLQAKADIVASTHAPAPPAPRNLTQVMTITAPEFAVLRSRSGTPLHLERRPGEPAQAFQARVEHEQAQRIDANGTPWMLEAAPWLEIPQPDEVPRWQNIEES